MKFALCSPLCLAIAGAAALALAPAAQADIVYSYTTTLADVGGPDTMQLNGADVHISFDVPDGSMYVTRFGLPAVPVNDALITISGSGLSANNGTFSLGATAFYPSFAGFFTEPGGVDNTVLLPGGDTLQVEGNTVATAAGSAVMVGDVVAPDQFGPTTALASAHFIDQTDSTQYGLVGTVITASQTSVPEPGSVAMLLGMGLSGAGFLLRRRRK